VIAYAEIRDVSAGFPNRPVLHDVSLTVRPGECVALVGPNGSGKSTLLSVVARHRRPSAGTVWIDGRDAWTQSSRWAATRVALSHGDDPAEWPTTVEQTVALGRSPHRGWVRPLTRFDRHVVESVLVRTGLTDLRHRPTDRLSDGEKQRVTLARALAQEPLLLLLDEPTANLDVRYQIELLSLVREVAKGGVAVVAAIHDLTLAGRWADRVVALRDGRVVADGAANDVLTAETIATTFGVRAAILRDTSSCTPIVVPLGVLT
jgi:iron complex transport system ATP-binding protein